jgi:hypothetical protein
MQWVLIREAEALRREREQVAGPADDAFLTALAGGTTITAAAEHAGISWVVMRMVGTKLTWSVRDRSVSHWEWLRNLGKRVLPE